MSYLLLGTAWFRFVCNNYELPKHDFVSYVAEMGHSFKFSTRVTWSTAKSVFVKISCNIQNVMNSSFRLTTSALSPFSVLNARPSAHSALSSRHGTSCVNQCYSNPASSHLAKYPGLFSVFSIADAWYAPTPVTEREAASPSVVQRCLSVPVFSKTQKERWISAPKYVRPYLQPWVNGSRTGLLQA